MKKIVACCALLLLVAPITAAQGNNKPATEKRPDLSGIWIPQSEKEKKPNAGREGWTNVIVEQHDAEVKFTLVYPSDAKAPKKEFTFYTDARGETNDGTVYYFFVANKKMADDKVKSETKWDGAALVTVHHLVVHDGMFTLYADLTMRWEISVDGKTLTRTTKTSNYSATYKKVTVDGDIDVPIPATGGKSSDEYKDTYILLEAKR